MNIKYNCLGLFMKEPVEGELPLLFPAVQPKMSSLHIIVDPCVASKIWPRCYGSNIAIQTSRRNIAGEFMERFSCCFLRRALKIVLMCSAGKYGRDSNLPMYLCFLSLLL